MQNKNSKILALQSKKIPPQAIDFEEGVLGALMIDKNATGIAIEIPLLLFVPISSIATFTVPPRAAPDNEIPMFSFSEPNVKDKPAMEPEAPNSFVSFGIMKTKKEDILTVYRINN